jgi:hypothetical protein
VPEKARKPLRPGQPGLRWKNSPEPLHGSPSLLNFN